MNKTFAQSVAMLVAPLFVIGIFVDGHLFNFINVDGGMDAIRFVAAAMLIYAGFISTSARITNSILLLSGVAYLFIGISGIIGPELYGAAPSGLTGFDVWFHILTGAAAIVLAGSKLTTKDGVRLPYNEVPAHN